MSHTKKRHLRKRRITKRQQKTRRQNKKRGTKRIQYGGQVGVDTNPNEFNDEEKVLERQMRLLA
jgi:hypothetical protein